MIKAYDDGYDIVHHGLLATCAIPTAADVPNMRAVMIALEAMFHWVFWSFAREDLNYNLPARATWDPSTLTWGGANSHNPMLGDVTGDFDLTPEEPQELAAEKKAFKQAYAAAHYAAMTPDEKKVSQGLPPCEEECGQGGAEGQGEMRIGRNL